jgi:hypothetical protein
MPARALDDDERGSSACGRPQRSSGRVYDRLHAPGTAPLILRMPIKNRSMAGEAKLRVLLADDHALVREGLKRLIDDQPDMEVIGEAGEGRQDLAEQPRRVR